MRLHLFEFEDQKWFPSVIRSGGTDSLKLILKKFGIYTPVAYKSKWVILALYPENLANVHFILYLYPLFNTGLTT